MNCFNRYVLGKFVQTAIEPRLHLEEENNNPLQLLLFFFYIYFFYLCALNC